MGAGIMPYSVGPAALAAIGSGDTAVLERVVGHHSLPGIDGLIDDRRDEYDDLPTAQGVLLDLVLGRPYDPRIGFAYAYGLEILCDTLGTMLPDDDLYPSGFDLVQALDREFAAAGIPPEVLSLERLTCGGAPVPLPPVEDFPGIGHLTAEQAGAAHAALTAARLRPLDADLADSLDQVRGWLASVARDRTTLVCFFY